MVDLTHDVVDRSVERPGLLTELGVPESGRMDLPIFRPQELQRDALARQFLVDGRPIGFGADARPAEVAGVQEPGQGGVRLVRRDGPGLPRALEAPNNIADGGVADAIGARNLARRPALFVM